jgi:hypothetical protein
MSANITSSDCIARNNVSGVSARSLPVCASKIICKSPVNGGGPSGTRCSGERAAIKLDTVESPWLSARPMARTASSGSPIDPSASVVSSTINETSQASAAKRRKRASVNDESLGPSSSSVGPCSFESSA